MVNGIFCGDYSLQLNKYFVQLLIKSPSPALRATSPPKSRGEEKEV
jgi:hypothetical protein